MVVFPNRQQTCENASSVALRPRACVAGHDEAREASEVAVRRTPHHHQTRSSWPATRGGVGRVCRAVVNTRVVGGRHLEVSDGVDAPRRTRELDQRAHAYTLAQMPVPATARSGLAALEIELLAGEHGALPRRDQFSAEYRQGRAAASSTWMRALMESGCRAVCERPWQGLRTLAWDLWRKPNAVDELERLSSPLRRTAAREPAGSIEVSQPVAQHDGVVCASDLRFVQERLWGVNPMVIERCPRDRAWPQHWQGRQLRALVALDWQAALAEGRIYVCDYLPDLAGMADARPSQPQGGRIRKARLCPRPTVFLLRSGQGEATRLLPLAIRLDTGATGVPDAEPEGCIVPAPAFDVMGRSEFGRELWAIAKTCVSTADANLVQAKFHLGQQHLWSEKAYVATERCFHGDHPMGALFREHLRYVAGNNRMGGENLLQQRGPVDRLFGLSMRSFMTLARDAVDEFSLLDCGPTADGQRRGLAHDGEWNLHIRWSGQLWQSIKSFCRAWVASYYGTGPQANRTVARDAELQAWAAWLSACHHRGRGVFPASVADAAQLVRVASCLLYHCSVSHSIVNYGQADSMGSAAMMPMAIHADYRHLLRGLELDPPSLHELREFRREMLPSRWGALDQSIVISELSSYQPDRLGHYGWQPAHPAAARALADFQQRLESIAAAIEVQQGEMALEPEGRFGRPFEHYSPRMMTNSPCL